MRADFGKFKLSILARIGGIVAAGCTGRSLAEALALIGQRQGAFDANLSRFCSLGSSSRSRIWAC